MKKKTYVLVGAGGRAVMFLDPIATQYGEVARLCGICDLSRTRANAHQRRLRETYNYRSVPVYGAQEFDRMLLEQKPDVVIVCTMDATHHDYIIRSVRYGCDVVCEKPITVDDEKCRAIREAMQETGRQARITFNYRWSATASRVYELLCEQVVGEVLHISYDHLLDTFHGADYFRRWHSRQENSGGLLVHKATHQFDLINWWLDAVPKRVFAVGRLAYYGKANAIARGDERLTRYERYTGNADSSDPFHIDLRGEPQLVELYLKAEGETGYIRDRNVFRDDIDICDSISLMVEYHGGLQLSYSLNAFSPYEGGKICLTGSKGRIEVETHATGHIIKGQSEARLAEEQTRKKVEKITVHPLFGSPYEVPIPEAVGGHGGGDPLIIRDIFDPHAAQDPLHRSAGYEQGIASAIIGIAANHSMATGQPVLVSDLFDFGPGRVKLSQLV